MAENYLSNLPVEVLRHIFQYCDSITILYQIGSVCKRLRAIAYQYNEIKLEISRGNYISYFLDYKYRADIEYYISEIARFTQVRCLILRTEYNFDLKWFLENLSGIQPISLKIYLQQEPSEFSYSVIPSMITKFNLQKLCWNNLDYKLKNMSWPSDCKLTYLAMNSCLYSEFAVILQQLSYLNTLRLNKIILDNKKMFDVSFTSRLTCLTIEECLLSTEHIKLIVSKTPALRNLTLIFHDKVFQSIASIYEWEKFVRTKLNFLDKFEFFISYEYSSDDMINLDLFIVPFQELFWLNEKHWNVACEYIIKEQKKILVYTPSNTDRFRRDSYSKTNGILLKQNNHYITKRQQNQQIDIVPCNTLLVLDFSWSCVNLLVVKYLIHALKYNHTLVKLDLNKNKIGDTGIKLIVDAFKNSKTLAILNLSDTDFTEEGAGYISIFLKTNTTLNELNIGRNRIKDTGIQYIVQSLQNNNVLTKLTIDSCYIKENGAHLIAHLLQNNTSLTMVNLAYNTIGDNGMQSICDALQKNRTLKEINIDKNEIGDAGTKYLSQLLQNNTVTLEKISMAENNIQDDGAQCLATALRNNRTLTTLDLNRNKIGTRGAEYLVNELEFNTTLSRLKSFGNKSGYAEALEPYITMKNSPFITKISVSTMAIYDDGAKLIADALRKNTVKELCLKSAGIKSQGTKYLADVLRENTTLEFLDLTDNDIGIAGVNFLISALSEKQTQTLIRLILGESYVLQKWNLEDNNMASILHNSKLPSQPNHEGNLDRYLEALKVAHLIRFNTTLTELQVKLAPNKCFGPAGTQQIADALHDNKTLKILNIPADKIGRVGIKYLMNELKNNTTLELLQLGKNCSFKRSLCIDLVYMIQTDQTLTTLEIIDQNIFEDGLIYLCHALSYHQTITSLTLINNGITSEKTIYLANMLKRNSILTRLCLEKNMIGDAGLKDLASALTNNVTLKILKLRMNGISANGFKEFVDALNNNTTLTVLK